MTDDLLIRMVKAGKAEAYRALVERYQDMVYNLCYKILLDEDEAKDAAQETFIKIYQVLGSFREDSKFSTWLYRIASNMALGKARRKKRAVPLEDARYVASDEQTGNNQPDNMSQEERSKYLHLALAQLDENDRLLLSLYYLEEVSMDETAEISGLDKNTVKVRMHRARKKLYNVLSSILNQEAKEAL
jgi:RNA polymerase sigma factor (sigma-70 family)